MSIETIGASTSGNSRTARREAASTPEDHQHQADDRGEDRPLDRELGDLHCAACAVRRAGDGTLGRRRGFDQRHAGAVAQLLRAFGDDQLAGPQAVA